MRILCWNVNGLRAIHKKGFLQWLEMADADIVCLQETRVLREELPIELIEVDDYALYLKPAEKKGYAGVGVYSKEKPKQVDSKLGFEQFDQELSILK
jgi:exodeoxyribonuclease-3